jgi:hypothetical protein
MNNYSEFLYQQCVKWGSVTFGKEALKESFEATNKNILRKLKDFCLKKGLKLDIDSKHVQFTFGLQKRCGR